MILGLAPLLMRRGLSENLSGRFEVVRPQRWVRSILDSPAALRQAVGRGGHREVALLAAGNSLEHHLPMADSIICPVARMHRADRRTMDEHFAVLQKVKHLSAGR